MSFPMNSDNRGGGRDNRGGGRRTVVTATTAGCASRV